MNSTAKEQLTEIIRSSDPRIQEVHFQIKRKQIQEDQACTLLCASITTTEGSYTYSVDYGRAWLGSDIVVFHRSLCLSNVISRDHLVEYYQKFKNGNPMQDFSKIPVPDYLQIISIDLINLYIKLIQELLSE